MDTLARARFAAARCKCALTWKMPQEVTAAVPIPQVCKATALGPQGGSPRQVSSLAGPAPRQLPTPCGGGRGASLQAACGVTGTPVQGRGQGPVTLSNSHVTSCSHVLFMFSR